MIIYYLLLPLFYLLSLLPFAVLYGISDFLFFILYRITGYRKKVVRQNLSNAFPEKDLLEIIKIERLFYHYLCDLFLETFKTLTISKKSMLKHCLLDADAKKLFDELDAQRKSVILVMGHFGNWEWAGNTFSLLCKQQLYVIYHQLGNKYFNNLMYKMRTRFSTKLIEMNDTFRAMAANRDEVNATAFIADQTPHPEKAYWTTFLNQDTPVFLGTEKIARKLNYAIVYVSVKRFKRGYYTVFAEMLQDEPAFTPSGSITQKHTERLEQDIIQQPETWLWSHKRWKHKKQAITTSLQQA